MLPWALVVVLLVSFRCSGAASQEQPQSLSPLLSHLDAHCARGSRNHCVAAATIKEEVHSVGPQQAGKPRSPTHPGADAETCSVESSQQQQQQQPPLKGHFSVNSKWRGWMRQHVMIVRHLILLGMAGVLSGAVYTALNIDRAPRWFQKFVAWLLRIRMTQMEIEKPSRILKYKMDVYVFSRPYAKLLLLSALTSALILFGGIALYVVSDEEPSDIDGDGDDDGGGHGIFDPDGKTSFVEALWAAAAGAGFDWAFYPSTNNTVRTVSLLIAVGGSFITALLLGIVSEALGRKVDELKAGRGAVLESNHLLILGWSPKVFALLEELAMGCELSGGSTIVVLSERDKNEMEYAIERQNINWRGSRLVLRQGSILDVPELLNVSAHHARSILILGDLHNPSSDARTLRCMMCLQHLSNNLPWGEMQASIILELCHADQEDLLTQIAGGPRVRTLCSPSLVGRVMVQCTRYPRLSEVLQEILGFEGNETYSVPDVQPILGLPFRYLQAAYSQAVPLGLRKAKLNMEIILNPRRDELVEEGDHVILLAEDEECLSLNPPEVIQELHKQAEEDRTSDMNKCGPGPWHFRSFKHWQSTQKRSRQNDDEEGLTCPMRLTSKGEFGGRFLFVGWRRDIVSLIQQLDNFCTIPSELYLYSSTPREARRKLLNQSGLEFTHDEGGLRALTLKHLKLHFDEPWLVGEPTVRLQLQMLFPLQFTAILLLAQDSGGSLSVVDTDCCTVASLMNLRQIQLEDLRTGRTPSPPIWQLRRGSSNCSNAIPADQELLLRRESSMTSKVSPFVQPSLSRNVSGLQDTNKDSKGSNTAAAVAAAASAAATAVAAANPTSAAAAAKVCPSAAADAAAMSMRALGLENSRPSIEELAEAALEKCDENTNARSLSQGSEGMVLDPQAVGPEEQEQDKPDIKPPVTQPESAGGKRANVKASSLLSVASKLKTMSRQKQMERLNNTAGKVGCSAEKESGTLKGNTKHKEDEKDAGKKRTSLVKKKEDIESETSELALQQLQTVVQRSTIVTELLDYSANTLLQGLQLSVKLFPHNLIAQIMALTMLSFERIDVLDYLFDAQGSKLFVRPISWLLTEEDDDISVSFLSLSQMASAQGEVLLGYTENASGAMILNPGNKTVADLRRSMLESVVTLSSAFT